ncbi:MAG: hypothetical protein LBC85_00925 [Fibromonadaceae bacterium]|jgi:hypothetical protein|nr:hypothetical protein [Fibromonadaceae bacterium]
MAIVKSLYDKTANVSHWDENDKDWTFNAGGAIEAVNDPSGAKASLQITSIPSPWARIDLVKTAFSKVNKDGHQIKEDGTGNIYDKIVSDTLDVGQLFFSYSTISDKVEIIEWDKETELENLIKNSNHAHRKLGNTLKMYLEGKKDQYKHDRFKKLYMLRYKNAPRDSSSIIGMTSPVSLFCSSANNQSFIDDIFFGQDKPFDSSFTPLRKRDPEYIKWLYALSKTEGFSVDFPEIYEYIEEETGSFSVGSTLYNEIQEFDDKKATYESKYPSKLKKNDNAQDSVTILDKYVLRQRDTTSGLGESDFEIVNSKFPFEAEGLPKPLILPDVAGNDYANWKYTYDKWGDKSKAPEMPDAKWQDRTLPFQHIKHPYLTLSDFLEDDIIRPSKLSDTLWNDKNFFSGNYEQSQKDSGYLLPLKDLFFKFFSINDLKNGFNGTKFIEMKKDGDNVRVTLRVPVRRGFVEFIRTYEGKPAVANDSKKHFYVINEDQFDFFLFPNIRFEDGIKGHYRAAIAQDVDMAEGNRAYSLEFCSGNGYPLDNNEPSVRDDKTNDEKILTWRYHPSKKDEEFEYIRIYRNTSKKRYSGVIIPIFKEQSNTDRKRFIFAVDFGTTNTHIQYSVDGGLTQPFNITKEDKQLSMLFYRKDKTGTKEDAFFEDAIKNKIFFDFIPTIIDGDYYFPLRTILTVADNCDYEAAQPYVFTDANMAFRYGKERKPPYDKIESDLKWLGNSTKNANEHLVRSFIESILFLIRNKVILNEGRLSETRIVWFYPVSMAAPRVEAFSRIWEDSFKKYFGQHNPIDNLIKMTESVAPYYNYGRIADVDIMATVDIGGGTTDIVLAENIASNGKINHIASFRFAANSLFSDGFNEPQTPDEKSGIVRKYAAEIENVLKSDQLGSKHQHLKDTFAEINAGKSTSNFAAFLFSLIELEGIPANIQGSLDYEKMLFKDNKMKVLFVIFYSAIVYHLAQLMKAAGMKSPTHIAFSGNGSKTIRILSNKDKLGKFASKIFEKVYGEEIKSEIVILQNDEPKKVTCDGGITYIKNKLNAEVRKEEDRIEKLKIVLKKSGNGKEKGEFFSDEKYGDIRSCEAYKKLVLEDVERYFKIIFDDLGELVCNDLLDATAHKTFEAAKNVCLGDADKLRIWLSRGIGKKLDNGETTDTSRIEEPWFFYPIIGVLNKLANSVCDGKI